MRGDRTPVSPTELAQLSRCEQQLIFDAKHGVKRSAHWRKRAAEGHDVHAEMHRKATSQGPSAAPWKPILWIGLAAALAAILWLRFGG